MLVSRNPFARSEVHRIQVPATPSGCAWCGNTNGRGKLYLYSHESDGGRKYQESRLFCSSACHNDFNS